MSMGMSQLAHVVSSYGKYMHNTRQIAQSCSVDDLVQFYGNTYGRGHDDKQCIDT